MRIFECPSHIQKAIQRQEASSVCRDLVPRFETAGRFSVGSLLATSSVLLRRSSSCDPPEISRKGKDMAKYQWERSCILTKAAAFCNRRPDVMNRSLAEVTGPKSRKRSRNRDHRPRSPPERREFCGRGIAPGHQASQLMAQETGAPLMVTWGNRSPLVFYVPSLARILVVRLDLTG